MRNLLIGGSGFVGSALAAGFRGQAEEVTCLSRSGRAEAAGVQNVALDLATEELPAQLLRDSDRIYILIGQVGPDFHADQELKVLERLANSLKMSQGKIYYFSSALVYGDCPEAADEQTPPHPLDDYAKFKLNSEQLLTKILPSSQLTILRLANVYGSPKNRGFINRLMNQSLGRAEGELVLNGNGLMERDYIFVDDVVTSLLGLAAVSAPPVVNIATGRSYSLIELVKVLEEVTGQSLPYRLSADQPSEPLIVRLKNQELVKVTNGPAFTSLKTGLAITLKRYEQ